MVEHSGQHNVAAGMLRTAPRTRYRVAVLESLKGDISGEVTVAQYAGYTYPFLLSLGEGDTLLRDGATYLFATRFSRQQGWYSIFAPGYGNVRLAGEDTGAATVARFRAALPAGTPGP